MDPLSITAGCVGLAASISTISIAISRFVSEVKDAKDELGRVTDELSSLGVPLKCLSENVRASGVPIADQLAAQIVGIISNCEVVIKDIGAIVDKCSTRRHGTRSVRWVMVRADVERLRSSLSSHKIALGIALTLVDKYTLPLLSPCH